MASIAKFSLAICLIGLSLVKIDACDDSSYSSEDTNEGDNYITVLGKDNFQRFLDDNENVLVVFYTDWCEYSMQLAPQFTRVAHKLHDMNSTIKLGKVNGDAESELTTKNSVWGYPMLKLYTGENRKPRRDFDNKIYWTGEKYGRRRRCSENIIAWLHERTSN